MNNPESSPPTDGHSNNSPSWNISHDEACTASNGPACAHGLFPIRAVASITGVNPITLRAWERRYNLIRPTRTATGHRLYSAADIQEIQRILALSAQGVGFTQIAQILARESRSTKHCKTSVKDSIDTEPDRDAESASLRSIQSSRQGYGLIESLKQAVIHMDPLALRRIEQQAMMWLPPDQVMRSILIETYRQLEQSDTWPDRDLGLHWFGHHVRQRLEWWLLQQAKKPSELRPLVLVDTPTSHRPIHANECLLIMALAERSTLQLLAGTLAEPQRARMANRWQARHWIRLLEPSPNQPECPGSILSGSTRLHWCQLISDQQALSITPNGVCQGDVVSCQRYLLEQIT